MRRDGPSDMRIPIGVPIGDMGRGGEIRVAIEDPMREPEVCADVLWGNHGWVGEWMEPDEDFESLLTAARAGAEWAWTSLYRGLAPGVLGLARARGARDPEGLLGEVFLQVV